MIDDGLFTRFPVDAVFGIHNWPGMAAGHFGVTEGPIMASSNEFRIEINGVGSHAALPHNGRDPVFTAVQIANGLQSIITRNKKPIDTAVLSITQIHTGEARQRRAGRWRGLRGTVRTFTTEALDLIETRMRKIAESTARGLRLLGRDSLPSQLPADDQQQRRDPLRDVGNEGNRRRRKCR